ncbi:MAG: hypothetical protein MUE44_03690 [Oscillatoriaceae cyanobacterium Prado104]|jgi:hypothetical protein|nr:hypothetical protein [Oscillatoriaceae cyanobacterium Prado104]
MSWYFLFDLLVVNYDSSIMLIGDFWWGGAGLFNLPAAFETVGEPFQARNRICCARYSISSLNPTGLLIMVQDVIFTIKFPVGFNRLSL